MIALYARNRNPSWPTDWISTSAGDIDQNQFQTQQTHDVANKTVAEQVEAENIASQLRKNNVHIMNKGEWTNEKNWK